MLRLIDPTGGAVLYRGEDITQQSQSRLRPMRRHMQIVFQAPYSSLNPRFTVFQTLAEPLQIHRILPTKALRPKAEELLGLVGLPLDALDRYPHEFSGGQRQRIAIARAMALGPEFIVADEPVSSLDVSIQAQVLNLFKELKEKFNLAYLFISHNLSVVAHLCDRVVVMYMGQVVEEAPTSDLLARPLHPYTQTLMAAVPVLSEDERPDLPEAASRTGGEVAAEIPSAGCLFAPRCPLAEAACREGVIPLENKQGRLVRCLKVS